MAISRTILGLCCLLACGCMLRGGLYSSVTRPLTKEFSDTPVGSRRCVIKSHRIREPITRVGVSAEWDSRIINAALRDAGITNVHFADQHTTAYFFNLYRRREIIFYGD